MITSKLVQILHPLKLFRLYLLFQLAGFERFMSMPFWNVSIIIMSILFVMRAHNANNI